MKVVFKPGSRFTVDPEVAFNEIERIRKDSSGDVEPDEIVEHAKSKQNPLHECFEWSDKKAAHEHRLERARLLMRSLVVVRDDIKSERPQRVYEVTTAPKTEEREARKVYRTMDEIMADPDTRAELLGRALRELIAFRNRYRDLQELAVVLRGIDNVLEEVEV